MAMDSLSTQVARRPLIRFAKAKKHPVCDQCRYGKRHCDGDSPCSNCLHRKIPCTRSNRKIGRTQSNGHSIADISSGSQDREPVLQFLRRGIGGQFFSTVQTLLKKEGEGLLRLAWSTWQYRERSGDLEFEKALRSASTLLSSEVHRSQGLLAATILLASYATYKHRFQHLMTLLHSIRVLTEAKSNINFHDEIGQQLLPITSLFIIYDTIVRPEKLHESMPIWDKCFRGTAQVARLGQFAPLPSQIGLATADELSHLARSTLAKTQILWNAYRMALPHEKPLAAEYLVVCLCICLEIFKQSKQAQGLAQRVRLISKSLEEVGPGGYFVTSFPMWHAQQTLVRHDQAITALPRRV